MRRRLRRRIEEAHALGIVLAPRTQGSKRRRFGAKPKMFDVWISEGGCKWNEIMVSPALTSSQQLIRTTSFI